MRYVVANEGFEVRIYNVRIHSYDVLLFRKTSRVSIRDDVYLAEGRLTGY